MGLGWGYTSLAGALGHPVWHCVLSPFTLRRAVELGLPQMIQSRAQFGYRGVVLVLVGTLLTFVGFNVADTVLTANGLHGILGWNEQAVAIVAAIASGVLAIYGHDWLHRIFRWCFALGLPLYTLLTLAIIFGHVPATRLHAGGFTWVAFVAQFAASASYNITYAPSVSDYSRYLPYDTRPAQYHCGGIHRGGDFGDLAHFPGRVAGNAPWRQRRPGRAVRCRQCAGGRVRHYTRRGFGAGARGDHGAQCLQRHADIITALSSLFDLRPTARLRVVAIAVLAAAWLALSFVISVNSIALVFAVLTIMLYLLIPWTAVNLVDYFYVRRGSTMRSRSCSCRMASMAPGRPAGWPLTASASRRCCHSSCCRSFTWGRPARALGGVDLGWLVGLVVSAAVYLWLSRSFDPARESAAVAESNAVLGIHCGAIEALPQSRSQ